MDTIMRRLGSGKRWWAAELVLRVLGLTLLGLCAAATLWLYRLIHMPPPHETNVTELLAALVAVLGWSLGWLLLVVGQGLFTLLPRPDGFITISLPANGDSNDRPDVAGDPAGPRRADVCLRAPVRESLRLAA